ncbi:MAG: helix-turn-helix transcriptional regulator [Moraxellaceae bacterium]|nr:helix-turn-helix transcriptional regulator [Moraxellaceae bacterium]
MRSYNSVGELVRMARNGRSQKDFAALLGVRQSSISRYESGSASPPVEVIEQCMRLVHTVEADRSPTAEELAQRVRTALADPSHAEARLALAKLVDAFESEHTRSRGVDATRR